MNNITNYFTDYKQKITTWYSSNLGLTNNFINPWQDLFAFSNNIQWPDFSSYALNQTGDFIWNYKQLTFQPPQLTDFPSFCTTFTPLPISLSTPTTSQKISNPSKTGTKKVTNGRIDNSYAFLTQSEAEKKAKTDTRLEDLRLCKKTGWGLSMQNFETDIPFGKKGIGDVLNRLAKELGCYFTVTSALGTKGNGTKSSPHSGKNSYASHFNAENNKLDIQITGIARSKALEKLKNSDLIASVIDEGTHFDIQINPDAYKSINYNA